RQQRGRRNLPHRRARTRPSVRASGQPPRPLAAAPEHPGGRLLRDSGGYRDVRAGRGGGGRSPSGAHARRQRAAGGRVVSVPVSAEEGPATAAWTCPEGVWTGGATATAIRRDSRAASGSLTPS